MVINPKFSSLQTISMYKFLQSGKIMSLIIRFRSKDGMFRLPGPPDSPLSELLDELVQTKLPPLDSQSLKVTTSNGAKITDFSQTLAQLQLKNGEMLTLEYDKQTANAQSISGKVSEYQEPMKTNSVAFNTITIDKAKVKQLPVDDLLDSETGLIQRPRSSFCRHTEKGMCEYCTSLPPWDSEYHEKHNIKHISFHSHLAHLSSETNKAANATSYIPPLQPSNFKVLKPCPGGHEPWPRGICSKCQPSAITLKRQPFRMVDHVEFQSAKMMNNFIDAWRRSGVQRIGLLLGTYSKYDKTPLGIKAKVEAIYEFPQTDWDDGVMLNEWKDEDAVLKVAHDLGLVPVGVIFTDLSDAGNGDGSVIYKRHSDSFFLSSLELIFAVQWQLKYPNWTKYAEGDGRYSSKFVTCVVSGNVSGEIDIATYQASETAEALVKADLICASTHPNQMFVKEQNSERYVPDIMYQMINEYGLEVKRDAKPSFPVEYLLVSLTHGFPDVENGLFHRGEDNADQLWPIENRSYLGEMADMSTLGKWFKRGFNASNVDGADIVLNELSDFHVLIYLVENGVLSSSELKIAVEAVKLGPQLPANPEAISLVLKLVQSPGWKTLATISSIS